MDILRKILSYFDSSSQKPISPIPNPITPTPTPIPGLENYDLDKNPRNFEIIRPNSTPTPMPIRQAVRTPQTSSADPYIKPNITVPGSQGGELTLRSGLSQILLNAFNNIGQATNSAKVLHHPADNPYLPGDPPSVNHITHGENASFKERNIDVPNPNGSIDRGLFRINNRSFDEIMADKYWGKLAREKFKINNWDDMEDPQKNAYMAKLIYERNTGWRGWFAAPRNLRAEGKPDLSMLSQMIGSNK